MLKFLVTLLAVASLFPACGNSQITTNVFRRVLHLKTGPSETATGFTIAVDGKEYVITAKHAVSHLGREAVIGVEENGKWADLTMKIYTCDDPVDIAVLIPPFQLTVNFTMPSDWHGFLYGQDVYFLGFPYNIGGPVGLNGPRPLPFVRKAVVSNFSPIEGNNAEQKFLFEGHNNPGFSGGPIVGREVSLLGPVEFYVIGVISGFLPEIVPVVSEVQIGAPDKASAKAKGEPWRVANKPDGTSVEYVDTMESAVTNTGIIVGYSMNAAIDLARKHPDGPVEKDLSSPPPLQR